MRALIISDIHANLVALETVLANAPAHDEVWCLGDVVGYGPHPNECVARLRALDALTLTGNHDQASIGNVPLVEFRDTARLALEWTQKQLTPENTAWLAAREPIHELPEYDVTLVHGSPRDPIWEYIENPKIAYDNLDQFETSFCFFGHTHQPAGYRWDTEARTMTVFQSLVEPLTLQPLFLLNPGSVGQPRDGDPRAAFAIYDTDTQLLSPYRIPYDFAQSQRAMTEAKLPERLIARLAHGV